MIRMPLLCAAAMLAGANLAHADQEATIVRGGEQVIEIKRVEHHLHRLNTRRLTKVVTYEIDDRIVTLGKAMAQAGMTDKNDLIHVELVHENVLLDPNKDYIRQNDNAINADDLIPSAHRLGRDLRANKATIVFGGLEVVPMHEISARPFMIIEKPDNGAPKRVIPSVPAPPKKSDKPLVAMAGQ